MPVPSSSTDQSGPVSQSGRQPDNRGPIRGPEHRGHAAPVRPRDVPVDAFTVATATEIARARRTGLTFAPEGGTWRMRRVINKLIREEDLYGAVEAAFANGWRRVKLYFLIGL